MPPAGSLVELARARSAEQPEAPAYTYLSQDGAEAERLTFRELDARARGIAERLRERGLQGERVLLLIPQGLDFVTSFLACLYAGAVAVPVYPPRKSSKQERLDRIAADAAPSAILTTAAVRARLDGRREPGALGGVPSLLVDGPGTPGSPGAPAALPEPDAPAFLQYTSGSTGAPKGVLVTHANLVHNQELIQRAFETTPRSRIVSWLPLFHDMGLIGGVLHPLFLGAHCVLMSPASFLQRPVRWLEAVSRYRATVSGGPDFAYALCVRKVGEEDKDRLDLGSWRVAFNGAEPVRSATLERFERAFSGCGFRRRAFFPCYGLAEATLFVSGGPRDEPPATGSFDGEALGHARVRRVPEPGDGARWLVASGRTWPGQRVRVVDPESGRPSEAGRVGEIWVAGPSVARGYWGRPEETRRTFGARLDGGGDGGGAGPYLRTGDLGFLDGGQLYVTGRLKDLIIIRGKNHYPQDVEHTAERASADLRPGCGAAFSVEVAGEERLVIAVEVKRHPRERPERVAERVREAVARTHEVRVHEVVLLRTGSVAKTTSGKIRRRKCREDYLGGRLRAVARSRLSGAEPVPESAAEPAALEGHRLAPEELLALASEDRRGVVETFVAARVAAVVGAPPSSVHRRLSLGSLGLDSLGAVELRHRIEEETGVSLPAVELLDGLTVGGLADKVVECLAEAGSGAGGPAVLEPEPEPPGRASRVPEAARTAPLAPGQRRLWFLHRLEPGNPFYNLAGAVGLEGLLDSGALVSALRAIVRRHEPLRTRFPSQGGRPEQRIEPDARLPLPVVDLSGLPAGAARSQAGRWTVAEARRPFDLARGPVLRCRLFRLEPREHRLVAVLHHIAGDGRSLQILFEEMVALYRSYAAGAVPRLLRLPTRYGDFAARQRRLQEEGAFDEHLAYWRRLLADPPPPLELPADRSRPIQPTRRGARRVLPLGEETSAELERLAREQGSTAFMVAFAVFQVLVHRYTGRERWLVGVPAAGRERPELRRLIGFFVNTLVLRADLSGEPSFAQLVRRSRDACLEAFGHQEVPLERLARSLVTDRGPESREPFEVLFGARGFEPPPERVGGLALTPEEVDPGVAPFDLSLFLGASGPCRTFALRYATDRFDASTAERMLRHYARLLGAGVARPETPVDDLPLLDEAERVQLLTEWSEGEAGFLHGTAFGATVVERFERGARAHPDRIAVAAGEELMSYGELDRRSAGLARLLRSSGVGPEVRVGLCLGRSPRAILALLAIHKAGGAFVPLDPAHPAAHRARVLEDAAVALLITDRVPGDAAGWGGWKGRFLAPWADPPEAPLPLSLQEFRPLPQTLAYVSYTSGSSGAPKGVAVEHRQLAGYVQAVASRLRLPAGAAYASVSTLAADLGHTMVFGALVSGSTLHLVPQEEVADAERMAERFARRPADCLKMTPSHLAALLRAAPRGDLLPRECLVLGGEVLDWDLVEQVRELGAPCRLVNHYGPTEATVGAAVEELTANVPDGRPVPLGRPLPGARLLVLDLRLRPTPPGVPGELCIGGAGLARGYAGRPAETAGRFVPDPFTPAGGRRLYRTGDLARFRPDGRLEFLGRIDRQIKVRGFRIEPGEVESALRRHPGVAEAVVERRTVRGRAQLVAYVVPEPGRAEVSGSGELRDFLAARLPAAMVPGFVVEIPAVPLTANGKVDRRALPEPRVGAGHRHGKSAPSNRLEGVLAQIFASVLGVETVGADEDFFELGGHSLLATQAVSRIRSTLRVDLPLRDLFRAPTVRDLGRWIESRRGAGPDRVGPAVEPSGEAEAAPLSFSQERLWFLHQDAGAAAAYNLPYHARFRGSLDRLALEWALAEVVRRHQELRARFPLVDGAPRRRIGGVPDPLLARIDLAGLDPALREPEAWRLARREAGRPFDPPHELPVRCALVVLEPREHLLLLTLDHLVSDAWSRGILLRELGALYRARTEGRPSPLPELRLQFTDFARWQRQRLEGAEGEALDAYWRERLERPLPPLELPTDRPRPRVRCSRGGQVYRRLPSSLCGRAAVLGRRRGVTPSMLMLAAFAVQLHRATGATVFDLGSPTAQRVREELEGLIGFFVNTLVLRMDLTGDPGFAALLERVRETALDAYAHQEMPFERLVELLRPERDPAYTPLFQAMFVFQNAPRGPMRMGEATLEPLETHSGTAKFDLTLTLEEDAGGLAAWLEYDRDLFERTTARRMLHRLEALVEGIVADPDAPVSELPVMATAERHQVLREWSDTAHRHARTPVHELFAARAARQPDAVALVAGAETLTYGALAARARAVAWRLRGLGAGPEVPVAVCLRREPALVAALLGILEAGAFYVPLDPAYPAERLDLMLRDSGAAVVVSRRELRAALPPTDATFLWVDEPEDQAADVPDPAPENPRSAEIRVRAENLAYLIYTSGSTGRPKGVAITHGGASTLVRWAEDALSQEERSAVLAATSICFDLSVFELFATLCLGGTLILASNHLALPELPAASRVTLVNGVPSVVSELLRLLRLLRVGPLPPLPLSVRTVMLAGEPLPGELVDRLHRHPGVTRVLNLWGPTEDTTYSTWTDPRIGADPIRRPVTVGGATCLGRPLPNTRTRLLDRRLRPVPIGVPGEMFLAGAGLARGYQGRPALTAERFVPDPFGDEAGGRLYATGDLMRALPDGDLDFLGRIDHQVKVRGFRIEPGEIEARLSEHPLVEQAVVTAVEVAPGDLRLVAHAVASDGGVGPDQLTAALARTLPAFMVPERVVLVRELPRTPNGKVDRAALSRAETFRAEGGGEGVATGPTGDDPVENLVADVFRELLGTERVDRDASFFALGGHSLLAVRLVARLRDLFRVELPISEVFLRPSARELAAALSDDGRQEPRPPVVPSSREGAVPLSAAQKRLWFLHRKEPTAATYNMSGAVRLEGVLDVPALAAAVDRVVERHEVLRTRFPGGREGPVQVVDPPLPRTLPVVDLGALEPGPAERAADRLLRAEARRPFDLDRGPVLRCVLLRLAAREHRMGVTFHHIVCDGWSLEIFLRELGHLYRALLLDVQDIQDVQDGRGAPAELPDLPVQYADYAVWEGQQGGGDTDRELEHWRRVLEGAPTLLELPADRPRPLLASSRGAKLGRRLPDELATGLLRLGRSLGATPFMTMAALFLVQLGRYTGRDDLLVGFPEAGRTSREVEPLVGLFVNTLVLRGDLSGDPTFEELLARVRRRALEAYAHRALPFDRLVGDLDVDRGPGHSPLFQVMLAVEERLDLPELPRLEASPVEIDNGVSRFDLTLVARTDGGSAELVFEYREDLFDRTTIGRWLEHLETLTRAAVRSPERPVTELPMLGAAECHRLLVDWQVDGDGGPEPRAVLEAIGEHVRRRPDALAVADGGRAWTYRALDQRARSVARRLRAAGAGRGALVALFLPRSPELAAAVLGTLRAGAAYLPVDPEYPADRIAYVLRDSGARVVVTDRDGTGLLPRSAARVLVLDRCEAEGVEEGSGAPVPVAAGDRAYVIYTSGSTGRPKGTEVSHGGLANLVGWHRRAHRTGPGDRTTLLAAPGFDASVWELFSGLASGATLCVAPRRAAASPPELWRWIAARRITQSFVPTPLAERLLAEPVPEPLALQVLLTGGDRLHRGPRPGAPFRLVNHYGPTEASVVATAGAVAPGATGPPQPPQSPSIGRPIAGVRALVADPRGRPVPTGIPGELVLGGRSLARGYLARPALTAERFVPDPFGDEAGGRPGSRLYRTGDLVRYRNGGQLEFLGRVDRQIELRGFRIEPGEIESVLAAHPELREAVVDLRTRRSSERVLVAYVSPADGADPAEDTLRSYLRERLPPYMVPAAFVSLPELPRDAHGKVARRALPDPGDRALTAREGERPLGEVESEIAALWAELLGIERVGADDSFFDLGGHSLLATEVLTRVQERFEVSIPLEELFIRPTLAHLAGVVERLRDNPEAAGSAPIRRVARRRGAGRVLEELEEEGR